MQKDQKVKIILGDVGSSRQPGTLGTLSQKERKKGVTVTKPLRALPSQ